MTTPAAFLRRAECDRPVKNHHNDLGHRPPQGDSLPTIFSRVGGASRLVPLGGDVETNPGPCCYERGQDFRRSDTPITCLTPACGTKTHEQTHYSGVPRSQQSLPWRYPTDGRPGSSVTVQTSYVCYSGYHPLRPCKGVVLGI